MAAAGQPTTPLIPVRGGCFGGDTEATLFDLLFATFGEGVYEAIAEITAVKAKELAAERAKVEKEAEKEAKEAEKASKHEAAAHGHKKA